MVSKKVKFMFYGVFGSNRICKIVISTLKENELKFDMLFSGMLLILRWDVGGHNKKWKQQQTKLRIFQPFQLKLHKEFHKAAILQLNMLEMYSWWKTFKFEEIAIWKA